jgi:hypothetical protein
MKPREPLLSADDIDRLAMLIAGGALVIGFVSVTVALALAHGLLITLALWLALAVLAGPIVGRFIAVRLRDE